MAVVGGTQAAGLVPLRVMGGQRWMDAGARATKGEGEVEAGEVVEEVAEEEESPFLYGWSEMKQEGEEEGRTGGVEKEMMEGEGQMWEVEVVGMEVEVVGMEAEVVVEELMEDQG